MADFPSQARSDVDRGWAWLALGAALLAQVIMGLLTYSLGVIQIVVLDTFDGGLVKTTWVMSITSSLLCLPGPLFGILTNVTSCRTSMLLGSVLVFMGCTASAFVTSLDHLFVTLSLMTGLGAGMVYSPAIVVVGFYFEKYLGIAMAISFTGGGIGMLAGPPLVSFFQSVFGWSGMFLMLGGLSANLILSAMICRPNSVERTHWGSSNGEPKETVTVKQPSDKPSEVGLTEARWIAAIKTSVKVVGSLPMLLFCSSIFLWSVCISLVNLYLPSYAVYHGTSTEQSSLLFTVMGVCNIISRLLAGVFVSFVDKFFLYSISFTIMSLITIGFPFIPATFTLSMVFAGLLGLCTGGPYVVLTSMTKDLVGLAHLATAFGVEMMVSGIGFLVGPPVAGLLAESSGSYTSSFVFAGVTCGCSAFLGFVLMKCKRSKALEEVVIDDPEYGSHMGSRPSSLLFASQLSIPGVPSPYLQLRSKAKKLQVPPSV